MSEVQSMPTFLKQHQKAIIVCAVVVLVIVALWLSKDNGSKMFREQNPEAEKEIPLVGVR